MVLSFSSEFCCIVSRILRGYFLKGGPHVKQNPRKGFLDFWEDPILGFCERT